MNECLLYRSDTVVGVQGNMISENVSGVTHNMLGCSV